MDNLPRYFALESLINNKYLRYLHEDGALQGYVEFSGEEAISPYTKYELEPAKNQLANKGLFNILCCYNNRYWTRKEASTGWITATAAKPVEDQFEWSCTLFEPYILPAFNDGKSMLRLRHVQDSHHVPVSIGCGDSTYSSCLQADANPTPRCDFSNTMFYIIDWEQGFQICGST